MYLPVEWSSSVPIDIYIYTYHIYLTISRSVHLSVFLPDHSFFYNSTLLSINRFINLSLSNYASTYQSSYPLIDSSIYRLVYVYISRLIYLPSISIYLYGYLATYLAIVIPSYLFGYLSADGSIERHLLRDREIELYIVVKMERTIYIDIGLVIQRHIDRCVDPHQHSRIHICTYWDYIFYL